jgi:hypothetical protein
MSGSQGYATSLKKHKKKRFRVFSWAHIGSLGKVEVERAMGIEPMREIQNF